MTDKLCCGICEHYQAELQAVLASDEFSDIQFLTLPARCGHPPLTTDDLTASANALPSGCNTLHLLGGSCLAGITASSSSHSQPRIVTNVRKNCFALFVNEAILEQKIREGNYLTTPEWLARWRDHVDDWGFDRATARSFFGEWATQLLLLDTGVDPQAGQHLQEFSDFVQIPGSVLPAQEQLAALRELAMIGDIFGIHDFLNNLEHSGPQYAGFVTTIRGLAKSFHLAKIQEVLHASMTPSP